MNVLTPSGWHVAGYEIEPTENCGAYPDTTAVPKKLWHTTESGFGSGPSVIRLFKDPVYNSSHYVVDPGSWRRWQLVPITRAGCALEHPSSVPHTNGALVVQTEIVGRAAESHTWNDNVLLFLARHAVDARRAQQEAFGKSFAHEVHVTFYGLDAGFTLATTGARQRMQGEVWRQARGHVGHQHAPGNSHWDPGKLNVARIVELANLIEAGGGDPLAPAPTTLEGYLMALTDEEAERTLVQAAKKALLETVPAGILNGDWEKHTRGYLGDTAVVVVNHDELDPRAQFLVGRDSEGWFKTSIPNLSVHGLLVSLGIIERNIGLKTLDAKSAATDEREQAAWVASLPTR